MSYHHLKQLIESGAVKTFDDWFNFIEQKKFMEDTGMSVRRLQALRRCPEQLSIGELKDLADLIDIDPATLGVMFKDDFLVKRQ